MDARECSDAPETKHGGAWDVCGDREAVPVQLESGESWLMVWEFF